MSEPKRYWYDEKRNVVWPYDGTYGGDECLKLLVDSEELETIRKKAIDVLMWYYRVGAVGGAIEPMDELRKAVGVTEEWLLRK